MRLIALGTLLLEDEGGAHVGPLARARVRALLALLARAGEAGMTRDRLCAYLWPESPPARARHSLDQALYLVRKEMGPEATGMSTDPLALDAASLPSDLAEFTRALAEGRSEDAVALYGGPFLDGFHLSDAPEFERWVEAERAVLHRQYTDALERAAQAADAHGDLSAAGGWWRRLAAAEPYSSRVVLGLMRALARAGDHGGALEAARVHEVLLAEELGAAADPAVAALAAELRREPPGRAMVAEPASRTMREPERSPEGDDVGSSVTLEEVPRVGSPSSGAALSAAAVPRPYGTAPRAEPAMPGGLAPRVPSSLRRRWRIAALIAGALTVSALAVLAPRDSRRAPAPLPAVAVLPFTNETGDSALEPVGRIASDWIANGLIRTGLVRVAEAGATARLAAEVSGRVYRGRDTLWLQTRIVRAASGEVAAVLDPIRAPTGDPTGALEPLRKQVLAALGTMFDPRLAGWRETALRPPAFEAYRAFAVALEEYSAMRAGPALAGFAEAAALDRDYAQPRLWAASLQLNRGRFAAADSILATVKPGAASLSPLDRAWLERLDASLRGDHERAFRAARRMVEIAPNSGWIGVLWGTALDTRRPAVAREAVLRVAPETFGIFERRYWSQLAWADHMLGEHRRELETVEAGIRAIGRSWPLLAERARALAAHGQEEALEEGLAELVAGVPDETIDPGWVLVMVAYELRTHGYPDAARRALSRAIAWYERPENRGRADAARYLAQLFYEFGDDAGADSTARILVADTVYPGIGRGILGLLAARRGDRAEAERWSAELARLDRPYLFGDHTLWRAQIAAALGDRNMAIELLRQAAAEGLNRRGWDLVHVIGEFNELRGDPAFQRVVAPRR